MTYIQDRAPDFGWFERMRSAEKWARQHENAPWLGWPHTDSPQEEIMNTIQGTEIKSINFRQALIAAARENGSTPFEVARLRRALVFPRLRRELEALVFVELDNHENSAIQNAKFEGSIDWEGIRDLLKEILPLIFEFLKEVLL